MTKLTLGEIIAILVDNDITVSDFVHRGNTYARTVLPKSLGRITTLQEASFEEYEEQGRHDRSAYVNHFVDHDVYLSTPAEVDSYSLNETYPFGYGKQVFPKEKVVTIYE